MIYKERNLNCNQEELDVFISSLETTSELRAFTQKYNGVYIENKTNNINAKYYVLKINDSTLVQPQSPFHSGFVEVSEEIMKKHMEEVIDSLIFNKFEITEERKELIKIENLEQQIQQQNQAISDLTMMIAMTQTPSV